MHVVHVSTPFSSSWSASWSHTIPHSWHLKHLDGPKDSFTVPHFRRWYPHLPSTPSCLFECIPIWGHRMVIQYKYSGGHVIEFCRNRKTIRLKVKKKMCSVSRTEMVTPWTNDSKGNQATVDSSWRLLRCYPHWSLGFKTSSSQTCVRHRRFTPKWKSEDSGS